MRDRRKIIDAYVGVVPDSPAPPVSSHVPQAPTIPPASGLRVNTEPEVSVVEVMQMIVEKLGAIAKTLAIIEARMLP